MISENKLKHTIGVARKCEKLAVLLGLDENMQQACFIMGFLHDIGYENCNADNITSHPAIAYEMLCNTDQYNHSIHAAIRDHGQKYQNLTLFDNILNLADLTINHKGEAVSIKTRLNSIKEYHGESSEHYGHAVMQANALIDFYENINSKTLNDQTIINDLQSMLKTDFDFIDELNDLTKRSDVK